MEKTTRLLVAICFLMLATQLAILAGFLHTWNMDEWYTLLCACVAAGSDLGAFITLIAWARTSSVPRKKSAPFKLGPSRPLNPAKPATAAPADTGPFRLSREVPPDTAPTPDASSQNCGYIDTNDPRYREVMDRIDRDRVKKATHDLPRHR